MSIKHALHLHHDRGDDAATEPSHTATGDLDATYGHPSTGAVMSRGGGELGEMHDRERDQIRPHTFGSPNDAVADRVRPPLS